jgi:hypothetical protein
MDHFYGNAEFGENWFSYFELYKQMVERFPSGSHFVEVGCWKGKSAAAMAVEILNSDKEIKFDCIDPWYDQKQNGEYFETLYTDLYETFLKNIEPVKDYINPLRMTSMEAVDLYKDQSLDFVFIDANHEYEYVYEDIKKWLPKVKYGGVLAGHDISYPPIFQALKDNNLEHKFKQDWESWIYEKITTEKITTDKVIIHEKN